MVPFLLDTVVAPTGEGAAQSATKTDASWLTGGLFGTWGAEHPVMLIVIYCVLLLVIMYFLSVRPTQKKEKQLAEPEVTETAVQPVATAVVEKQPYAEETAEVTRVIPVEKQPQRKAEKSVFKSNGVKKSSGTKTVYKAPKK